MLGNGSVAAYSLHAVDDHSEGHVVSDRRQHALVYGSSQPHTRRIDVGEGRYIRHRPGHGFFGNRLNVVGDVYRRDTKDMFTVGMTLPAVFGNNPPKGNYADLKTMGWEVSVAWRDAVHAGRHDLTYGIKAMLWDSRSWVTRYNNATKRLTDYYEGHGDRRDMGLPLCRPLHGAGPRPLGQHERVLYIQPPGATSRARAT